MEAYRVIKNPLSTEKAIRLMETENKLLFVVDKKATKEDVKKAVEKVLKVKVAKVRTFVNQKGQKRAYITLSPESLAVDVATELGLM
ncbi:50S ribosomal protein L23 [Candidatus Woesearchaeota archaeon]|nr:50S ribosomal protein L23 [Candidatus Woesearchaeota archaeon]